MAVLLAWRYSTGGFRWLILLNVLVALATLSYACSRARFIIAARDWPYAAWAGCEIAVLVAAIWAGRSDSPRIATVVTAVAFGLHAGVSVVATVFAFTFKITRLM